MPLMAEFLRKVRVGTWVRVNDTLDYRNTVAVQLMDRYRGRVGRITEVKYPCFFTIEGCGEWLWEMSNVTFLGEKNTATNCDGMDFCFMTQTNKRNPDLTYVELP